MYLCNFSRENQDLSTMAVNTLQKDFRHSNALVRAAALKAMASLQYVFLHMLWCGGGGGCIVHFRNVFFKK